MLVRFPTLATSALPTTLALPHFVVVVACAWTEWVEFFRVPFPQSEAKLFSWRFRRVAELVGGSRCPSQRRAPVSTCPSIVSRNAALCLVSCRVCIMQYIQAALGASGSLITPPVFGHSALFSCIALIHPVGMNMQVQKANDYQPSCVVS